MKPRKRSIPGMDKRQARRALRRGTAQVWKINTPDGGRITVFLTEITTKAARFGECGSCGTAATEWGCLCGDLNDRSVW